METVELEPAEPPIVQVEAKRDPEPLSEQAKTDRMSEVKDFLVNIAPCMQSALPNASLNSSLNQAPKLHQDQPDTGDSLNDPSAIQTQTFQNSNNGNHQNIRDDIAPAKQCSFHLFCSHREIHGVRCLPVRCSFSSLCLVSLFVCLFVRSLALNEFTSCYEHQSNFHMSFETPCFTMLPKSINSASHCVVQQLPSVKTQLKQTYIEQFLAHANTQ